jgi:adenylate cyclase class IV
MPSIEIEIKSLLGGDAGQFKTVLHSLNPMLIGTSKQLNHYFIDGDVHKLFLLLRNRLSPQDQARFTQAVESGKNYSVRTRLYNDRVLVIVKASIDHTTSANGITRIEFEAETAGLTLEELDNLLLEAGYRYQAKWSREREEYQIDNVNICLDKNAGYGYVAEFEIVVDDAVHAPQARQQIDRLMQKLGAIELPQDRLERMFAFYNANWQHYYGTDKTFTVD